MYFLFVIFLIVSCLQLHIWASSGEVRNTVEVQLLCRRVRALWQTLCPSNRHSYSDVQTLWLQEMCSYTGRPSKYRLQWVTTPTLAFFLLPLAYREINF